MEDTEYTSLDADQVKDIVESIDSIYRMDLLDNNNHPEFIRGLNMVRSWILSDVRLNKALTNKEK